MQQPDKYDYGDPELWEHLGNPLREAEQIAMCCQEFWERAFSWPNARTLARIHRHQLRHAPFACPFNPFTQATVFKEFKDNDGNPRKVPDFSTDDLWNAAVKNAVKQSPLSHKVPTPLVHRRVVLSDGVIYVRGHRLATQKQLMPLSEYSYGADPQGAQWGPVRLPPESHNGHYCIVGMTRSGKTVLIRHLVSSLKRQCRFVIYDDKTDLVPFLSSDPTHPASPLYILNPFDKRSAAWDIAKDAPTPHRADEIAQILIPDQPTQNPYFVETPRALMATTINALNRRVPGKWSFLDLLIALENIQAVLKDDEPSQRVFTQHLAAANDTAASLISTLAGHIRPFKTAAAAWSHATERFSITEWSRTATGTVVLGNHANYEYAMRNINRVLLHLVARALLDPAMRANQQVKKLPRTYIILDELHQLHNLDKLDQLVNQGAGLGVNLVLGFQDIQTLRKHYGEATDGLIGQCAHYAFFRIGNPTTAHWASAVLGTQEVIRQHLVAGTVGEQQTTSTSSIHIERSVVPPAELQQLPLTSSENGLTAYFKSTCHPTYRGHIPGDVLFLGGRFATRENARTFGWVDVDIAQWAWIHPEMFPACYLPLEPPSALPAFEPRPEEHLLFPESHTPHLERLGFSLAPSAPTPVPTSIAPPPPQADDFDPDRFPRLRGRRPPKDTR